MSDDHSPGTGDSPTLIGADQGRHAETHDVRREELTNPVGPQREDPSFAEQLAPVETGPGGGHMAESAPAADDKVLHNRLLNSRATSCRGCRSSSQVRGWSKVACTLTSTAWPKGRSKPWVATRPKLTATSPSEILISSSGTVWSGRIAIRRSSGHNAEISSRSYTLTP